MELSGFIEAARERGAFRTDDEAQRAARAVVRGVAECLDDDALRRFLSVLPRSLAPEWQDCRPRRSATVDDLALRIAQRENVSVGFAHEHLGAVLDALRGSLPEQAVLELRTALPVAVARFLEPRTVPPRPPRPDWFVAHTLAGGRPGSRRPLSEGQADEPQTNSVADENPHGDSKVSSAGTTEH